MLTCRAVKDRNLAPMISHAETIGRDRFNAGFKYAGYDKVIFRGKSPNLVYLYINNDKVEILDASQLRGKGAVETAAMIKQS